MSAKCSPYLTTKARRIPRRSRIFRSCIFSAPDWTLNAHWLVPGRADARARHPQNFTADAAAAAAARWQSPDHCRVFDDARRAWYWHHFSTKSESPLEHPNSGKKASIRFDFRYRVDFFDSIRFANLINLPLLHWYSNSNDGELGEGPGGVSLRCGSFCAISVSIRQFPTS